MTTTNQSARTPSLLVAGLVAAIAVGLFLVLVLSTTQGASFYHDEWWYICGRSLSDAASWFLPHNEHFVLVHVIAYRLLVDVFGLGSYLPFQIALVVVHLALALGVAAFVDRHANRWAAIGAGVLMLFLGTGYENLFWAFQIGFVGSAAMGMWALVVVGRRTVLAALVLCVAVATQGIGLFFVVACGGYLLAQRRFRAIAWLALPLFVYGTWAIWARDLMEVRGETDLAGVPTFVILGIGAAAAGTVGVNGLQALVAAVAVLAARPVAWRSPVVIACAFGLLAMYGSLGLSRQAFADPGASRYIYVGAAFIIPAVAVLLASARFPMVGVALFVVALAVNASLLVVNASYWVIDTEADRATGSDEPPIGVCYESPSLAELKEAVGTDG